MIEDLGPSVARFNSIDATTDGSGPHWFPGLHSPLTLGFSIVLFLVLVVTLFRCGLQKCAKKSGVTGLCGKLTHIQEPDTHPPPPNSTPASCETLDMEAEMERLGREIHNPTKLPEENHYLTPHRHLQEVIKQVNESAINRALAVHYNDTLYQKQQEEAG